MIGLFLSFLYYPSVNFIDVADLTRIIGRFLFNFHYIIGQLSGLRKAFSIFIFSIFKNNRSKGL